MGAENEREIMEREGDMNLKDLYQKLKGISREIFDIELNEMKKHSLFVSNEAIREMEKKYQRVMKIFADFLPFSKEEEKLKEFAMMPIEKLQQLNKAQGSSINYFRFNQARDVDQRIRYLLATQREDYRKMQREYSRIETELNEARRTLNQILLNPSF